MVHRVKVLATHTHMHRQSHSCTELHMYPYPCAQGNTRMHNCPACAITPVHVCNHTQLHTRGERAHGASLKLSQGNPRLSQETSDGSHHRPFPQPVRLVITARETGIGCCVVKSRPLCHDLIPLVRYSPHLPILYSKCQDSPVGTCAN